MHPKDADRMTNSVDTDQTAPSEAVRSGSTLFAQACLSKIVPEPVGGLIMSSRPKGLKVYSYVKKYAEFKNQTLKKIGWYIKLLYAMDYPRGELNLLTASKWGYPCT